MNLKNKKHEILQEIKHETLKQNRQRVNERSIEDQLELFSDWLLDVLLTQSQGDESEN
jgi:hypothetical protein